MKYYNTILQGEEASHDRNAIGFAQGFDFSEDELTEQRLPNLRFIDCVNGIDVWYDFGADYYCFSDSNN